MLKIGVLGAGHLGKIHLKILKSLSQYELVGFFDPNESQADSVSKELDLTSFGSIDELLNNIDVVDVVTPTLSHFDCAEKALKKSKHVFIEKPITNTIEEAKILIGLSNEANVKVQVGHVERFNPAYQAVKSHITNPMFIETHRLAQFNPRGTDVSVVLDLMIHDIDIVLSVVKSTIKRISASGVAVISDTPDIANARIEFDNGCVANLTSSRISLKNMRKSRFFQRDAYISVDFLDKKVEVVNIKPAKENHDQFDLVIPTSSGKKQLHFDIPEIKPTNAIEEELITFHQAITENKTPIVTIQDGHDALDVAYKILDKIKLTSNITF